MSILGVDEAGSIDHDPHYQCLAVLCNNVIMEKRGDGERERDNCSRG